MMAAISFSFPQLNLPTAKCLLYVWHALLHESTSNQFTYCMLSTGFQLHLWTKKILDILLDLTTDYSKIAARLQ